MPNMVKDSTDPKAKKRMEMERNITIIMMVLIGIFHLLINRRIFLNKYTTQLLTTK